MCVLLLSVPRNMSLIFGKTSMALVKTIGDEELRPVRCFSRANKIRRFSILEKKSRFLFLESDVPHEVSLMNILESSSSVPGIVSQGHGRQRLESKGAVGRNAETPSRADLKVKGQGAQAR